jgi:hypothetical protein
MAMIAGLPEEKAWKFTPGKILDLYHVRREYDEYLHGFVKRKEKKDGDWD